MPTATKIMIIRHAEKPPKTGGPPLGVTGDGANDPNGLVVRGWTRSGALAALFAPSHGPMQTPILARPQHLFACTPEAQGSHRPHDTIVPLSRKLGIDIDDSFGQDDFEPMVARAMAREGVVLICWEHKRIQNITAEIPRRDAEPPDHFYWPGNRFDVVFVFDLDGGKYRFSQVPELLLDGDTDAAIDVHAPSPPKKQDDDD
jgi:hypothetical protein